MHEGPRATGPRMKLLGAPCLIGSYRLHCPDTNGCAGVENRLKMVQVVHIHGKLVVFEDLGIHVSASLPSKVYTIRFPTISEKLLGFQECSPRFGPCIGFGRVVIGNVSVVLPRTVECDR